MADAEKKLKHHLIFFFVILVIVISTSKCCNEDCGIETEALLPNGINGTYYEVNLTTSCEIVYWHLIPGNYLPTGLSMETIGTIKGTANTGTYSFEVNFGLKNGNSDSCITDQAKTFYLTVP